jgi:hypothetical protein
MRTHLDRLRMTRRLAAIVLIALASMTARAQAAPVTLTWDFNLGPAGLFTDWRVSGSVLYDYDPLVDVPIVTYNPDGTIASVQDPIVPVDDLLLNFGPYSFNLSHAASPAIFFPLIPSNNFGLSYTVQQSALPSNITHIGISPGAALFFTVISPDIPNGVHLTQQQFSVPEPSSMLLMSGAVAGALALRRRRARKTTSA